MARSTFGGEIVHVVVTEDATNADALVLAASVTIPLYDGPGGALQNNFLLWDANAQTFSIAATQITTTATGMLPPFQGPDGLEELYDADGNVLRARDIAAPASGLNKDDLDATLVMSDGLGKVYNQGAGTITLSVEAVPTVVADALALKADKTNNNGLRIVEVAGVWYGDVKSRPVGVEPTELIGSSDPADPTDGVATPANLNDGDVWTRILP